MWADGAQLLQVDVRVPSAADGPYRRERCRQDDITRSLEPKTPAGGFLSLRTPSRKGGPLKYLTDLWDRVTGHPQISTCFRIRWLFAACQWPAI